MLQTLSALASGLADEALGMVGGALFLGSWVLQAWESRRAGQPVVSMRFFGIRAVGCVLLTVQGLTDGSLSLTIVMGGTFLLMIYNMLLLVRR